MEHRLYSLLHPIVFHSAAMTVRGSFDLPYGVGGEVVNVQYEMDRGVPENNILMLTAQSRLYGMTSGVYYINRIHAQETERDTDRRFPAVEVSEFRYDDDGMRFDVLASFVEFCERIIGMEERDGQRSCIVNYSAQHDSWFVDWSLVLYAPRDGMYDLSGCIVFRNPDPEP